MFFESRKWLIGLLAGKEIMVIANVKFNEISKLYIKEPSLCLNTDFGTLNVIFKFKEKQNGHK